MHPDLSIDSEFWIFAIANVVIFVLVGTGVRMFLLRSDSLRELSFENHRSSCELSFAPTKRINASKINQDTIFLKGSSPRE